MNSIAGVGESRISVIEEIGSTVAVLRGDVDSELRSQAGEALAIALDRGLPLILDLTDVRSVDSVGIAFVIQCCTIGNEEGLCVMLRNPPPAVSEVLGLLGLDHTFDETIATRAF
ncbi:STAS domain-containing protein [Pengzhenrongella phosphoraccumulans]|uniref:STAS domain-containing protein n=1 Tax=Pengzhenrongella phosphoraccumulans TaxID=3114394 RepID=UPI00388F5D87